MPGILERREFGQQVVELEHEPDVPVAERRQLVRRHRRQVGIADPDEPPSIASRPPSTCSSVLFPTPDAPTIATISPFSTESDSRCKTGSRVVPTT